MTGSTIDLGKGRKVSMDEKRRLSSETSITPILAEGQGGAIKQLSIKQLPEILSFSGNLKPLNIVAKGLEDPKFKSKLDDFLMIKHLGQGAYATVKLA